MDMITLTLFGHPFAACFSLDYEYRTTSELGDDACLAYVQSGKQEVYSPTQKIVAREREGILMNCGNYIANFAEVTPTAPFRSVVFHLDSGTIRRAFGDKDLSFLRVDQSKKQMNPALKIERSELLDSFVESMMPYFNYPELAKEELLSLKMQELVYILSDSGRNPIATQIIGTLYNPGEIALDEIIASNLHNNLSVAELAHLTARSVSTFKRDFKKRYKQSPAKYFKTKRLEKSADLLRNTSLQVSQIAWDCGFENPAHFSTSFHNHFGESPRQFRS